MATPDESSTTGDGAARDDRRAERERMVDHIAAQGVTDARVLDAMREVPRHAFVPEEAADLAYADAPAPIGEEQTISQPYVVALMAAAAAVEPGDRVLEIGTGSGYGAAVLSRLAAHVYTVERIPSLARRARQRLAELGYDNVSVLEGDGSLGWPEHAPYDAIVVTAGGPDVPPALVDQLAPGGRLVMPVGRELRSQRLVVITKRAEGEHTREELDHVVFVPLIGAQGWPDPGPDSGGA